MLNPQAMPSILCLSWNMSTESLEIRLFNAGALVITDSIISRSSEPVDVILGIRPELAPAIRKSPTMKKFSAPSWSHGHRNRALINYLCSFDNIANDTEQILTTYFYQCSLAMSCMDLARSFRFLVQCRPDAR